LSGNDWTNKDTYAQDVIQERTLDFIRVNKNKPFFLYVPHLIPHAELVVPDDSLFQMYEGQFPESRWGFDSPRTVYGGNAYGASDFDIKGYAPVEKPRAVFAAMVSRLDHHVGEILSLVKELGLDENTLVIFTSDNGPHQEAGADPDFFESRGPLKGYKRDLYEGGIRVPHIARWPGKIEGGSTTDHVSAFWDLKSTLAEITGRAIPENTDGISFLPTLLGTSGQKEHDYLYWEFHERGGRQALRKDDWKLVRYNVLNPRKTTTELYNLNEDISESINVASEYPELTDELLELMSNARVPSELFTFDAAVVLE
jgi:arylsulfatase A-like enzyme